jgi:AcrR family transcriptional regulator
MSSAKPSRDSYHHGDLRHALEEAALHLVAERGVEGFTLAETSRSAGVSVAAPFRHFQNKDALLASLALRGYEAQQESFAAAISRSTDPVEQLALFGAAYVGFSIEHRALFDVTFNAGLLKDDHPELELAGQRVLEVLREPAEHLCTDKADAIELIENIGAAAHGFAVFLRQGIFGDPEASTQAAKRRAANTARALALTPQPPSTARARRKNESPA